MYNWCNIWSYNKKETPYDLCLQKPHLPSRGGFKCQGCDESNGFYHQIIGLEILSQTETEAILGLGKKALVHLIQAEKDGEVREHYGLYHLAILLPTRKALADVLKHLSDLRIPLVGVQIMDTARPFI